MAMVPTRKREGDMPISSLQREMNRLFDEFFGRDVWGIEPFRGMGEWRPSLDVAETDESVVVKAELPGIEPKDVQVSLSGDVLTIKGDKKEEKEEKTKNFHRMERSYGFFERSIQLPMAVKPDSVKATFKNGVLTIELPKAEEAKAKAVKISVE